MTQNSQPQKPDWFKLIDSDAPSAQVMKINRKLPAIAALVAGGIIATGAFFSTASEPVAHADQNSTASVQSDPAVASAPLTTTVADAVVGGAVAGSAVAGSVATGGIANPTAAGVSAPRGGGDDEYGDDDGDRHEGRGSGHDGDRSGDHDDEEDDD